MQKPNNSSIINICLIPSDKVSISCEQISQSLKYDNTMFALGDGKFAHMTVFMTCFANENIEKVAKLIKTVTDDVKPFDCVHSGYFITEGRYFEVSYERSESIMALQQAIIDKIASLRINPGNPFEGSYFAPFNKAQQQNAIETGYDLVGGLYRPHITLTRYTDIIQNIITYPDDIDLSFRAMKLCVYLADDNGAVYEKIEEYNL